MLNKTALIVDDSRTACQMLRLMLERESFQVDVLGSAEDALGYLQDHRPGIIFMDHLMPGMDGFQAVKEIKGNPAISAIPIVMYTSKSGELYVGQAHALGAVDILPKPPTRDTLRAVFRRIDERAAALQQELSPAAQSAVEPAAADVADAIELAPVEPAPEPLVLRAVGRAVAPEPVFAGAAAGAGPAARSRLPWRLLFAVAASFAAGVLIATPQRGADRYLAALSWALSDGMPYAFEESPFGGARVARIKGLVDHLAAAGFEGTVRLEGHAGQFCLVAGGGGWRVPDPALPIEACDTVGVSSEQARQASGRQAPEFREFLQNAPLLAGAAIVIEVQAMGDTSPRREYPPQGQVSSAGDWNRIAAENNRVTVTLIPRS